MFEARKQTDVKSEAIKKNPENVSCFRGLKSNQTLMSLVYLLLSRLLLSASELNRIMPVFPSRKAMYLNRLVGYTTDRELHPAPKVII